MCTQCKAGPRQAEYVRPLLAGRRSGNQWNREERERGQKHPPYVTYDRVTPHLQPQGSISTHYIWLTSDKCYLRRSFLLEFFLSHMYCCDGIYKTKRGLDLDRMKICLDKG